MYVKRSKKCALHLKLNVLCFAMVLVWGEINFTVSHWLPQKFSFPHRWASFLLQKIPSTKRTKMLTIFLFRQSLIYFGPRPWSALKKRAWNLTQCFLTELSNFSVSRDCIWCWHAAIRLHIVQAVCCRSRPPRSTLRPFPHGQYQQKRMALLGPSAQGSVKISPKLYPGSQYQHHMAPT